MAGRRIDDLDERVGELRNAVDCLLDDHLDARERLAALEAATGTGPAARPAVDLDLAPDRGTAGAGTTDDPTGEADDGPDASADEGDAGDAPDEEASSEEVAAAVREVETDPGAAGNADVMEDEIGGEREDHGGGESEDGDGEDDIIVA